VEKIPQPTKLIGVIEDIARETSTGEIGVWTDGVGIYSDGGPHSDFKLQEGKRYKITVEELNT
jgi:hypothetical protein